MDAVAGGTKRHNPVRLQDMQKAQPAQNKQGFTVGLLAGDEMSRRRARQSRAPMTVREDFRQEHWAP
jgi:hypothetical protein